MLESVNRNRARKGTRSCTECRRRKVRCIRLSEDTQVCRGCEERGSTCTPQKYSSQPVQLQKKPSRYRISQLESKVASLSKVVHNIELKLGYQPTEIPELTPEPTPGSDDSDDDRSESDVLGPEPSHLRSLFQNDWLSADMHRSNEELLDRKAKAITNILDSARNALQRVIPPKEEIANIANSAFRWLIMLDGLFPQSLAVRSRQQMLESYDAMHELDVDPVSLASWLLAVAITAQQVPQDLDSPTASPRVHQKWLEFTRIVSETVEKSILSHDRILGTVQGLDVAMHFFRLQISQGHFQKAWIRLRHYIVIAELMGLPKASQAHQLNMDAVAVDIPHIKRAQLWGSICAVDRLFSMITNLPSGTRHYQPVKTQQLILDGSVQSWVYLTRLTDIATKIQHMDEMDTNQGSRSEIYKTSMHLDGELKALSFQTPQSWWCRDTDYVKPDYMVQFLHYCIAMRIHLPLTMRRFPNEEYGSSHLACIDACEAVTQRYLFLRKMLPSGFLLAQILDLQVFIATVVLLLTTHMSSPTNQPRLSDKGPSIESKVAQVVKLMGEKSNGMVRSFAPKGVATICSLNNLLQQDDNVAHVEELTLQVPLLGKVHIRRNTRSSSGEVQTSSTQTSSESGVWNTRAQNSYQPGGYSLSCEDTSGVSTSQVQDWGWDCFSWSVEEQEENLLQDTFMSDNFDQFPLW
ncbi:putative C6 finger domain protein [Tricladium varicosporioides]|nr:putative C6 finger domain protein [Hymenoscyphus varicosporioides]